MSKSQRMQNLNGSGYSYINMAARKDGSSSAISTAAKSAKKDYQELVKNVLNAIRAEIVESDVYNKSLDVKTADIVLMRVASLLDEIKTSFVNEELAEFKDEFNEELTVNKEALEEQLESAKKQILDEISGFSFDVILKNFLVGQITELFDTDAKKEDIIELKTYLTDLFNSQKSENTEKTEKKDANILIERHEIEKESSEQTSEEDDSDDELTFANKNVDSIEDETEGDYQDSTIAQNFQILQDNIAEQLEQLNDNIKNITGVSVFSGFIGFVMKSFGTLMSGVKVLTGNIAKITTSVSSKIFNISKNVTGASVGALAKSIAWLKNKTIGVFSGIQNLRKSVFGKSTYISSKIAGLGKGIKDQFKKISFKGISSKIAGLGNSIKNQFGKLGLGKISSKIAGLGKGIAGIGVKIISGIGLKLAGAMILIKGVGSLVKGLGKGLFEGISFIGKGLFKGIGFVGKGIFGGIGKIGKSIFGGIGKLGKGIFGGIGKLGGAIKGIGSKVKGIGSKVGSAVLHPFKSIGSFFKNRKIAKAEQKKEALREKFMNFMMNMFEKLWNFLEPILGKLKIYMLMTMIPIIITGIKILLIIAAITALIVGIVLAFLWVRKKALEFWNYIVSGELLDDLVAGLLKVWSWLKDLGKWLWDKLLSFGKLLLSWYVRALKFIFIDIPVWIWKKLVEFGQWLYKKFIYPYVVAPILKLREKLTAFLTPIMKKLQPFIESAQNLFARIKSIWANFKWDSSKSFFENLKCIASIVKDAVLDWWNTSPFKTFYEKYLEPIVKSVQDLIGRIRNIWSNFKWDESKSFLENLKAFWDQCWAAIKDWWNSSIIKTYWDMLVNYVKDLLKPLREWYDKSKLKEWVDGISKWIEEKITIPLGKTIEDIQSAGGVWPWFKKKLSDWWDQVCQIAKTISDAVVAWWEKTEVYKTYNEIKEKGFGGFLKEKLETFIDNMLAFGKKISAWWNNTSVGKWLNELSVKIEALKQKAASLFIHIPGWGGGKNIYPFAFFIPGKPFIVDAAEDKEAMEKKANDEKTERLAKLKEKLAKGDLDKPGWRTGDYTEDELKSEIQKLEKETTAYANRFQNNNLAQQQVANAMQPVNNINNMNSETNIQLQKQGQQIEAKAAAAEQATQDYRQQQQMIGSQSLAELHDLREEMRSGFKDPAVVPMPMPYGPQRNAAMMYNEESY